MKTVHSRRVYLNESFEEATLTFDGGKITAIDKGPGSADYDFGDKMVLPGLVDIHCHGYMGFSYDNATREGLLRWLRDLPLEGCTSLMAATSTAPEEMLFNAFDVYNEAIDEHPVGAQLLGFHVEGPFISFIKAGAQDKYSVRRPSAEDMERWQARTRGRILLCCIAPEMDDGHEMIKYCVAHGIRVAIGHTNAGFDEAMEAVAEGATDFTHTFNGMTQMEHRAPGVAGAAMVSDSAYAELIADGVHVHPAVCKALARCKGKDRLILITDSVKAKGLPAGEYKESRGSLFLREDGTMRLKDGTLCGSINKLNVLLGRAIREMGIDEVTAINAATKNPCDMLGIKNKGLLEVGRDADAVVFDDDFNVSQTFLMGEPFIK